MNNTKKRRRLIILLRQRTDLFPETMHLVLTCLFSLHQSLDPQLLLRQKSLRSQLRLKRLQSGGMSRKVLFSLYLGSFQLLQLLPGSGKLLFIDLNQGFCLGYGSSSCGNNLLCALYDDFRFPSNRQSAFGGQPGNAGDGGSLQIFVLHLLSLLFLSSKEPIQSYPSLVY